MSTSEEFHARMADLQKRLDAMANVNAGLVAGQSQISATLREIETNQNKTLAVMVSMDQNQGRMAEALDRLEARHGRTTAALDHLEASQERTSKAMDHTEREQERMSNQLAKQRVQTDELIQISGIQDTSIALLWAEFRKGRGSSNGDAN